MKTHSLDELITLANKIHSFIYLHNFNNDQISVINDFLSEYQKALTNYHKDKNNENFQNCLQILTSPLIVLQNLDDNNALKKIIINGIQPTQENTEEIKGGEDRSYARIRKNPNAPAYNPEETENPERINGFTMSTIVFALSTILTFFLISLLFILK